MVHLEQPQLSGLGRNPAAPTHVLVRLTAHVAGRQGLFVRGGRLADPVVEGLLAHGRGDAAIRLHGGDRVSPAMRHRIAEHPDPAIRHAFADFVHTSVESGLGLGVDALVETYGLSPAELAASPDPKLRAAIARDWHDRPAAVQEALLTDPDPGVRATAARAGRQDVPPALHERCLADPAVQAHLADRLPLTAQQFDRLLATGDEEVLHAVAGNPYLTAAMVARLQDSEDPAVRVAVAYSRPIAPESRDRLLARVEAEKAAGSIEAEVALHWSSYRPHWLRDEPLAVRLTYLNCPHAVFRQTLAESTDLPDEAWRRLDEDAVTSVRYAAARRPDAPAAVLLRLAREHGDPSAHRPGLVDHPNFPRHELRALADEPNPRVRRLALEDPHLPAAALRRLGACEDASLRAGVARHPHISTDLLERLLADPEPNVADHAAANPALPQPRMDRITAEAGL
ncbi:hypothetical protein [Streptomyces sp. NPDC058486]|uniref:hypothetical protein n=1 Tax=unclassified Streptomyces TaxID=2593676 RepID=UPI003650FC09